MQPDFLSFGTTPHRSDTAWTEAQRWLGALQNRACADPRNNGRRTDSYNRVLSKIAASIDGCLPAIPIAPVICVAAIIFGTGGVSGATSGFTLYAMQANGAEAVAVGTGGQIIYSDDGTSWTATTLVGVDLFSVTYGNGAWVTVGDQAFMYRSTDRITWDDVSVATLDDMLGVAFGAGAFVTVDTAGRIYRSTDGITWPLVETFAGEIFYNLTFGGGLFVGVGAGGFIATSPDGLTWTERTSGVVADLFDVTYNGSQFVAISANTATVIYSDDAVTWQSTSIASSDFDLYSVASGGGLFVVVTQDTGQVWVSSDGATWTRQTPDLCPNVVMVDYYVDCQFNVSLPYLPETTGATSYTVSDENAGNLLYNMAFNGDRIIVIGANGALRVSDNGLCWSSRTSGTSESLFGISYGNGIWATVGNASSGAFPNTLFKVIRSTDNGETWSSVTPFPALSSLGPIAFGNGLFVAATNDSTAQEIKLWTSPDAITWTFRRTVTEGGVWADRSVNEIRFVDGRFWALGGQDLLLVSADGITWTVLTVGATSVNFADIASNSDGSILILTGDDPQVAPFSVIVHRSTDGGVSWSDVTVADQMYGVAFGNGVFLLREDSGLPTYVSTDGLTWTVLNSVFNNKGSIDYYKDSTFIVI